MIRSGAFAQFWLRRRFLRASPENPLGEPEAAWRFAVMGAGSQVAEQVQNIDTRTTKLCRNF
jgi:hypothetical protein